MLLKINWLNDEIQSRNSLVCLLFIYVFIYRVEHCCPFPALACCSIYSVFPIRDIASLLFLITD